MSSLSAPPASLLQAPDAELHWDQKSDTLYTIWATAAIIVPMGPTGGNTVNQESRNYLHDTVRRAEGAVQGADPEL